MSYHPGNRNIQPIDKALHANEPNAITPLFTAQFVATTKKTIA
jgi:hypothetical protein